MPGVTAEPGVEAPLRTDRERAESVPAIPGALPVRLSPLESVRIEVGLEGVLSSCSAAGIWRVRDLAGLGSDDLFSGLRYVLSVGLSLDGCATLRG